MRRNWWGGNKVGLKMGNALEKYVVSTWLKEESGEKARTASSKSKAP